MTPLIDKAIEVAAVAHIDQKRKGDGSTPYIVHPIAVGMIVSGAGSDEATICAAILHDVLEDTDFGRDKLRDIFGEEIVKMVEEVSDKNPDDPWAKRKDAYLEHLKTASDGALVIACADKIHNLKAIMEAYKKDGEKIWPRFSASKEDKMAFYESVYRQARERMRYNDLVSNLGKALRDAKVELGMITREEAAAAMNKKWEDDEESAFPYKEGVDYYKDEESGLNCDIKDRDPKYKDIFEKAEAEVETLMDQEFPGLKGRRGYCFGFWAKKQQVLKEKYNIVWHSPGELNPDVLFD